MYSSRSSMRAQFSSLAGNGSDVGAGGGGWRLGRQPHVLRVWSLVVLVILVRFVSIGAHMFSRCSPIVGKSAGRVYRLKR